MEFHKIVYSNITNLNTPGSGGHITQTGYNLLGVLIQQSRQRKCYNRTKYIVNQGKPKCHLSLRINADIAEIIIISLASEEVGSRLEKY